MPKKNKLPHNLCEDSSEFEYEDDSEDPGSWKDDGSSDVSNEAANDEDEDRFLPETVLFCRCKTLFLSEEDEDSYSYSDKCPKCTD